MRKSVTYSMIASFAALHVVLYLMSFGSWRNWAIYIAPLEGIILGPGAGFTAALLGSSIGRILKPDPLWMFGVIAEPVSVLTAALIVKAKWRPVLAVYSVMLSAYFLHPFGSAMPLWAVLDVLSAAVLIYPSGKLSQRLFTGNNASRSAALIVTSFICVATDSLVRIFLLIPAGLYTFFFNGFQELYAVFLGGAVTSYFEDTVVVIVSFAIGMPILSSIKKLKILEDKTSEDINHNS